MASIRFEPLIESYKNPEKLQKLKNVRLLLIDELSAPASDAQREFFDRMLIDIVGERYDRQLSTLVTGNLMPGSISKDYPRLASRLRETGQIIAMLGEDRRATGAAIQWPTSGPLT